MAPLVLGAGVAGLAAAVELARAGREPVLIDARPFVGGRVRSFVHPSSGDEIDNGQHLMMGCYHHTFRLLDLIGTRERVAVQSRLRVDFRDADATPDILLAPPLPSPLDVVIGMLRLRGLSARERLSLLRVARQAMRPPLERDETVSAMLVRLGQSERARTRLWDPIVIATLNTAPDQASALLFLEVLRRAFLGRGEDSRLAFPRTGLSGLLDPAVDYIRAHGGTVRLGTSATRMERGADGFTVHVKDGEPLRCDQLICALPSGPATTLLGHLIPELVGNGIDVSPIVSIYLWYDRPLTNVPLITALIGTSVQWVFNRRLMLEQHDPRARSGRAAPSTGLLACTISAAIAEAASSSEDIVQCADAELRRTLPEIAGSKLIDSIVIKEKHATFRAVPGMQRPGTSTSVEGLYLAGDWTDTGLPATIEGAAQSGFAAALRASRA